MCFGCLLGFVQLSIRRADRQARLDRIPMAANAIARLKKTTFGNLDEEKKQFAPHCIICYADFKDDDQLSELACDDRHIFHTECIQKWLETDLRCPICKKDVDGSKLT